MIPVLKKIVLPVLSVACLSMVSCSDNDQPKAPVNAISLNMVAGDNSTTIGGSDVYINASDNFTSNNCGIADLGKKGGFSRNPDFSQIAQEIAVTPGHFYQITLADMVRNVAGARAIPVNTNYYNVYVDSWIYGKDNTVDGAKISYTECYPDVEQLPEWRSKIKVKTEEDDYYYKFSYTFPKGCEVDKNVDVYMTDGYNNLTDQVKFDIKGNQFVMYYPLYLSYFPPVVTILVRYESVYTRVSLDFE